MREPFNQQARSLVGDDHGIDIGVSRPYQYAVGAFSITNLLPRNVAAEAMLRRPVCGPCLIWGVTEWGDDLGYDEVTT